MAGVAGQTRTGVPVRILLKVIMPLIPLMPLMMLHTLQLLVHDLLLPDGLPHILLKLKLLRFPFPLLSARHVGLDRAGVRVGLPTPVRGRGESLQGLDLKVFEELHSGDVDWLVRL